MRKQLKYPPFCDIIVIGITAERENDGVQTTKYIHQYLKNRVIQENLGIILYQGMPAPIDKIKNKYRFRIIIKCKFGDNIIKLMEDMQEMYSQTKQAKAGNTRLTIDLNPNNWY